MTAAENTRKTSATIASHLAAKRTETATAEAAMVVDAEESISAETINKLIATEVAAKTKALTKQVQQLRQSKRPHTGQPKGSAAQGPGAARKGNKKVKKGGSRADADNASNAGKGSRKKTSGSNGKKRSEEGKKREGKGDSKRSQRR